MNLNLSIEEAKLLNEWWEWIHETKGWAESHKDLSKKISGYVEKNTLKPCPFCGGEVVITFSGTNYAIYHTDMPGSKECPIYTTSDYDTREEAFEAWNKRYQSQYV